MRASGMAVKVVRQVEQRSGAVRNLLKYAGMAARTFGAAVTGGYQVVVAHYIFPSGPIARIAAGMRRAPLIIYSHGSDVLLADRGWPIGPMTRSACRHARLVIVPSADQATLVSDRLGVPADRIRIIPIGVDAEGLVVPSRAEARSAEHLGEERVLLFAGALDSNKGEGLGEVLHALAREPLAETRLIAVGEGPRASELRALAEDLAVASRVTWLPFVERDRILRLEKAADAVVVPSRRESLGLVALESAALGTPVIATRVGGLPEHVRPGVTGELYEPGDVEGLVAATSKVLSSRDAYSPTLDPRFTLSRTGEALAEACEEAIESR
jgi:D-inositol-3-phosphate glycosyltransferase